MHGNKINKYDENGQLSCGIYSSPAAAGLLCKVGSAIARYIPSLESEELFAINRCPLPRVLSFLSSLESFLALLLESVMIKSIT